MSRKPFLVKKSIIGTKALPHEASVRSDSVVMGGMQPGKVATSKLSRNYCGGFTFNSCALDDLHVPAAHSPCTRGQEGGK